MKIKKTEDLYNANNHLCKDNYETGFSIDVNDLLSAPLRFIRSFNFTLKNRFFQYQKQVKMFVLPHDWFPMKFVFTY